MSVRTDPWGREFTRSGASDPCQDDSGDLHAVYTASARVAAIRVFFATREAPVIDAGEAGAKLDSAGGKLGLALRVFDLSTLKIASLPQDSGPDATIAGALNKPSAHTEVGVVLPDPTATPKTHPPAAAQRHGRGAGDHGKPDAEHPNLGTIPSATFSLDRIPRIFDVCLATDNTCRAADRAPAQLSNYTQSTGFIKTFPDPSQNATAGGNNRPYASQVSMDFNDQGSSGTSSAIASMVTMPRSPDLRRDQPAGLPARVGLRLTRATGSSGSRRRR